MDLGRAEKDTEHEKLEDMRLGMLHSFNADDLSSQMQATTLEPKGKALETELPTQAFPLRPAFGDQGNPVLLWANYYTMTVKASSLWKYPIKVEERSKKQPTDESRSKEPKSKDPGTGTAREVKGRKLYLVMEQVYNFFSKQTLVATEFKSQLLASQQLELEFNPMLIKLPTEDGTGNEDEFVVSVLKPTEILIGDLLEYILTQKSKPYQFNFPPFPECVDALNLILGTQPRASPQQITAVGSSRFFPFGDAFEQQKASTSLAGPGRGRPLEALRGFFQSVRISTGRLLLNVNVTCGVFKASGSLTGIFRQFNAGGITENDGDRRYRSVLTNLTKTLSKARVKVTFMVGNGKKVERTKTIHNLVMAHEVRRSKDKNSPRITNGFYFAGPKQVSFYLEEDGKGRYITVADHFKNKYGMFLEDYPLLNMGSPARPVFFPAELITLIPGQSVKAKLMADETTKMLNLACQRPDVNATAILTAGRTTLGLDNNLLSQWGMTVDNKLLVVQGRELQVPPIKYLSLDKKPAFITPQKGSWNFKDKLVARGATIPKWSVLQIKLWAQATVLNEQDLKNFETNLRNAGIGLQRPVKCPFPDFSVHDVHSPRLEEAFEWAKQQGIRFFLVVFSGRADTSVYGRVKILGDCIYGIHTSCVLSENVLKKGPSYAANVALKWNLKAGGANHILAENIQLLSEKTMVVGYDVTHPTNMPVSEKNRPPSLVGMVASIAPDLAQWPATVWEQSTRQEMLDETLVTAFQSRLELWRKHNKILPERIIIFRDGVSEGQFQQVLEQELPKMRIACQKLYKKDQHPKLTIVVSVKRHHTRFYPAQPENTDQSTGNIKPGTVVDRGVTQTRFWDFYLTAHSALKGTARPAHYTVLLDEIFREKYQDQAPNKLEKLTHELCYLFGRATKAVSICPPAYYADIVCERARYHRPNYDFSDTESVASGSTRGQAIDIHPNLRDTMYYL
ncbi:unnamed protein product [Clonostachys rosea]|uniref:Piwi domain-containing protein n=1 Tax=Bionectria ochroleuca TaxID=29856 RepID=A0ABY6TSB1_BIOOC|nr:unnamed protein product [Clonostachys rosea]